MDSRVLDASKACESPSTFEKEIRRPFHWMTSLYSIAFYWMTSLHNIAFDWMTSGFTVLVAFDRTVSKEK